MTFRIRAFGQDSVIPAAVGLLVLSVWVLSTPMVPSIEFVSAHEIMVSIWTSQSTYKVGEGIVINWQLGCLTCDGETSLNDVLGNLVLQGPSISHSN